MVDSPQWPNYRTVIQSKAVDSFLSEKGSIKRLEDQWNGVVWLLCRKPDIGRPLNPVKPNEYLIYVIEEDVLAGTRGIRVLYSYGDNEVNIFAISFVDEVGCDD